VGEYQGRRRGRPEPEPAYQEPEYDSGYPHPAGGEQYSYPEDPAPNYFSDDAYYGEDAAGYGYPADGGDLYYPEPAYADPGYTEADYAEPAYADPDYAEPRFEPVRRRHRGAQEPELPEQRAADEQRRPRERHDRRDRFSAAAVEPNHLPYLGGLAAALIAASFIRPGAVAAVVLVAQAAVAWAVLDLLGVPGRRAAVIAFLPAVGADYAAFRFSPYVSATGVAAGVGCGFVLAAADSVLRARRHGVEPGASKELAATVAAQLFACLAGLFVAAARMDSTAAAGGGVLAGLFAYAASRNRELSGSRTAVVGFGCTAAALASYAAAILVT
jgi:hypothetical protein